MARPTLVFSMMNTSRTRLMAAMTNMSTSILLMEMLPKVNGSLEIICGYVRKVGPIVTITRFSRKMEAPMAEMMKYKPGAFLFRSGR